MITAVSIILYLVAILSATGTGATPEIKIKQRKFGTAFTALCFLLAAILQVAA